ncbi:MAG: SHOCT domain-containing protein [Candidatus Nanopelagicales bacterium]
METLGSVLYTTLWIFALICYLMVLFYILSDMFSDHELSGWWKAVWIVFLIFLPFLTALVYLIARGKGMQQRAQRRFEQMKQAQDSYIKQVAAQSDPAEQIAKAKQLHDQGVIDDQEFAKLKEQALA